MIPSAILADDLDQNRLLIVKLGAQQIAFLEALCLAAIQAGDARGDQDMAGRGIALSKELRLALLNPVYSDWSRSDGD